MSEFPGPIMHKPQPGPLYWDWRCLLCDMAVDEHATFFQRLAHRFRTSPVASTGDPDA